MIKELKIIHILHHRPNPIHLEIKNPEDYNKYYGHMEYITLNNSPYWVGFFRGDHHHISAFQTLKRTKKYKIECWRPYGDIIDRIYSKEVDGIVHKVFPSKMLIIKHVGRWFWSHDILNELKKEIKKNRILVHLHDGHSTLFTWLVLKLKKENIPIIYQHRSQSFSIFRYKNLPWSRKFRIIHLFNYFRELKAMKYISHYFSGSLVEEYFLKEKIGLENVSFLMDGEDFCFYKPEEKKGIKKKFGLPVEKKIILYVGRYYRVKRVDLLIKVFKRLIAKNDQIALLLVGGYEEDEFFQLGKDDGAIMVKRVQKERLKLYYQAADIYVMLITDDKLIKFAGFGSAPIQALASGLPLLSNNIIHFPGTRKERDKIGMTIETEEILEKNIEYMLSNPDRFKDCRRIAKKYFDINVTNKILRDKYDELFQKYYGDE
jgi:glycosyltransferase involved in cell wall biosynthesis